MVTSWNKTAEVLFGFWRAEIIGASIKRIVPLELHPEGNAIVAGLRRGNGVVHLEAQRQSNDGRVLVLRLGPCTSLRRRSS